MRATVLSREHARELRGASFDGAHADGAEQSEDCNFFRSGDRRVPEELVLGDDGYGKINTAVRCMREQGDDVFVSLEVCNDDVCIYEHLHTAFGYFFFFFARQNFVHA